MTRSDTKRRTRLVGFAAIVAIVTVVLATLAIPGEDPTAATTTTLASTTTTLPFDPEPGTVYAFRTTFTPAEGIEVAVGDTLVFENRDAVDHTFTSDEGLFDSGPVEPEGGDYGYSYTAPGRYSFHCELHPTMTGTVQVVPQS